MGTLAKYDRHSWHFFHLNSSSTSPRSTIIVPHQKHNRKKFDTELMARVEEVSSLYSQTLSAHHASRGSATGFEFMVPFLLLLGSFTSRPFTVCTTTAQLHRSNPTIPQHSRHPIRLHGFHHNSLDSLPYSYQFAVFIWSYNCVCIRLQDLFEVFPKYGTVCHCSL